MKKAMILVLIVAFLSLSMAALAADKTPIQERWDGFIENAELKKEEYVIENDSTLELTIDHFDDEIDNIYYSNDFSVFYGLGNTEVDAYNTRFGWISTDSDSSVYNNLGVSLKNQFYHTDSQTLAVKGFGRFSSSEIVQEGVTTSSDGKNLGGGIYSNTKLGDIFTIYNNVNMGYHSRIYFSGTNGFKLDITAKQAIMAKVYASYAGTFYKNVSLLYKNDLTDQVTYMLEGYFEKNGGKPEWRVENYVDVQPTSSTLLSANVDVHNAYSNFDGRQLIYKNIWLGAEQKLGKVVTLGAEYHFNIPHETEYTWKEISGNFELNIGKHFQIDLTTSYGTQDFNDRKWYTYIAQKCGLSYDF